MARATFAAAAALASLALAGARPNAAYNGPVIGVWSHPGNKPDIHCEYPSCEYLVGSYVKWIEAAGGLVVPLPYNASDLSVYDYALDNFNGILFPGGAAALPKAASYVVNQAIKKNDAGDFFPVWGTCLGFEWLQMIIAGDESVVTDGWKTENMTLPTKLTAQAAKSRMVGGDANARLRAILEDGVNPVTFNYHSSGLAPSMFDADAKLNGFWDLLGTNDELGKPFVSMTEGKAHPIYAVQFHPEKNMFERSVQKAHPELLYEDINHTPEGIFAAQALGNFFLAEAQKNTNKVSDPKALYEALIHNYPTVLDLYGMYQERYIMRK